MGRFLAIFAAVLFHAAFILFGGLLLPGATESQGTTQEVELIADEVTKDKQDPTPEKKDDVEKTEEPAPDAAEIIRNLEKQEPLDAPALDAASLGALERALEGIGAADGFVAAANLIGGGRIGGTGSGPGRDQQLDSAFSMSEIDQKPRVMMPTTPMYPLEMRGKKVEGVVAILFVVDAAGKVVNPKVETSSHTAFEKPALDALRQWKFEPAIKSGQRVSCRTRQQIRFPPN